MISHSKHVQSYAIRSLLQVSVGKTQRFGPSSTREMSTTSNNPNDIADAAARNLWGRVRTLDGAFAAGVIDQSRKDRMLACSLKDACLGMYLQGSKDTIDMMRNDVMRMEREKESLAAEYQHRK